MFLVDLILDLSYDLGVMWLAASPPCPKCGGEAMRAKKQADRAPRWHCRDCSYEWSASIRDVIDGKDGTV